MKLPSLHKLSVKTRLAIAMGGMFVPLLVLTGGTLFYLEKGISAFEKTENQALEEIFPLTNLESLIIASSNPVRKYTLNGNATSRSDFLRTTQEIEQIFTTLQAAPSNLPESQILLQSSRKQWQQASEVGQTVFSYPNPVNNTLALHAAEKFYERNFQTITRLDRLHKILAHIQISENLHQVQQAKQKLRTVAAVTFLLGVSIAVVTSAILVRSIVQPLSILKTGVANLGNGDFSHRILLTNQDELGQLAAAFNLMIEKLEQSQKALKDLATIDELTGVYNRREFNKLLNNELERSGRYSHCFSLLLLDIDHFKKLNDTYGHQAGDEALRQIAAILKREFRELDRVARYGGEEFVIILPETSGASAYAVAERIRHVISNYYLSFNGETIKMTVSGGLATFPEDAKDSESLIYTADQALYTAKRSGRDRIIIYSSLSERKTS